MRLQRGFTLIELAIVLVIVTLLIGGLAAPLSAQIQARRVAETRQLLQEARDAVLGYAMTHAAATPGRRHLPCPDTDVPPDGRENRSAGQCDSSTGTLPWVALGTAPHDAWGNRLRYAVIQQYADSSSGFSASSGLPDPLKVCSTRSCTIADVADNLVVVLVSHGPNGWGAHNVNGTTQAAPSGPDETQNLNLSRTYVSRAPTQPGSAAGEFDDLLIWLSRDQLVARVCPPGSDCNP